MFHFYQTLRIHRYPASSILPGQVTVALHQTPTTASSTHGNHTHVALYLREHKLTLLHLTMLTPQSANAEPAQLTGGHLAGDDFLNFTPNSLSFPASLGTLPPLQLLTSVPLAQPLPPNGVPSMRHQQTVTVPTSSHILPISHPPAAPPPTPSAGLILSPAAAPFPQKLVDKVRSGQFIEMRELLADNISLVQQLHGDDAGT